MAGVLSALGIGKKEKLTPAEIAARRAALMQSQYVGAVPGVDAAYKSDPRTATADALLAQGRRFDPVQGGMTEGIARALSGAAGGFFSDRQRDKYNDLDKAYAGKYNAAAAPTVRQSAGLDTPNLDPQAVVARAMQGYNANSPAANLAPRPAPPPQQAAGPPPTPMPGMVPGMPGSMQQNPSAIARVAQNLIPQQGAPQASVMPANPPLPGATPVSQPLTPLQGNPSNPVSASPRVLTPGEPAGVTRGGQPTRANTGFNSYQSAAYDPIEAQMEQKYNLPSGTLRGLRFAERSNANQVSPTGARTVYQFVRGTRRGMIKNYGVDPYASPEQAAEAAALHIRESLDRGRDMNGALRDYRGADESADPGWYTRARAEQGQPAAGDPGAQGTADAPQIARAELPPPPTPVARPSLGDRVRSSRLQIASRLLEDTDPENAAAVYMLSQPLIEAGLTEDQASKMQRDENESQLTNQGYSSDLQRFNQQSQTQYEQPFLERNAAIAQEYAGINRRAEANNALRLQHAQDKAALERAQAEGANGPAWVGKEVYQQQGILQDADTALAEITRHPNATGPQFHLGVELSQYQDQPGVEARAAIQNLAGYLLNKRSGAAVTPEEFRRNAGWLPNITDDPATIRKKITAIQAQANGRLRLLGAQGSNVTGGGGGLPMGQGPQALLPPGVTVEVVP